MQSDFKQLEAGKFKVDISLDHDELEQYVASAQKRLQESVMIDGFRKGKAPENRVKQQIPEAQVREIALQESIQKSLDVFVQEQSWNVLRTSDLKVEKNTPDLLQYTVTLFTLPSVALPELSTCSVEKKPVSVEEKEINEAVDVILNMRAKFLDKDAPAAEGDRVEVDFSVSLNGAVIEGGESKNHPLVIGGKNFIPGFEDQLVGMRAGDAKEFTLTAPEDYFRKDLAGKNLAFQVTMRKVQTVQKPELNDAFIHGLGTFKDIAQFKESVKEGIFREKQEKETQRVRLAILDKIIEKTKIEVPLFFLNEQLDSMVASFDAELHTKGMELNMYLAHIKKSIEDLRKDWQKDAERQAKIFIVLDALARAKQIEIAPQEVDQALNETVQALVSRGEIDLNTANLQDLRARIVERLRNEKTLEFMEGAAIA